ncbi:MAG: hypothetical protein EOO01_08010 [Chitinophagaceae bacterium]|nr:MAG: hypothetical protein EOO01_08010 [Chitinophagaceae bacterium]
MIARIAICLATITTLFYSCTKVKFKDLHDNPGQLRFCNIATWTDTRDEMGSQRINVFTYDEHGNPLSVTSNFDGTGNSSHFFRYDELLRLSEYEYEDVETRSYHYTDSKKKADSATVTDVYGRIFSDVFTYDESGRIIKSVRRMVSSPFEEDIYPDETHEYVYLNDDLSSIIYGGSQQNPDVTYSDKPSVYMTNSVWKFINQNYSKHAVAGVDTRNTFGLPLTFTPGSYQFPFLDIGADGSSVTYQCE